MTNVNQALGAATVLISNFILLAFTDLDSQRTIDLIGVNSREQSKLQGYMYDSNKKTYVKAIEYDYKKNISLAIPSEYRKDKKTDILVSGKEDDYYYNSLLLREEGNIIKRLDLPQSTATPFLTVHPQTMSSAILLQGSEDNVLLITVGEKGELQSESLDPEIFGNLDPEHSSANIDLRGTLKADYALMIRNNEGRALRVVSYEDDKYVVTFEMKLPEVMGPMIFGDFNGNGMNDLAFVCKENNEYYLKVYLNNNSREDIKTATESSKYVAQKNIKNKIFGSPNYEIKLKDLDPILENKVPVLSHKSFGGLPCGIIAADPACKNKIDLFITVKDKSRQHEKDSNGGETVVVLENNINEISPENPSPFIVSSITESLKKINNVTSISFADYESIGREAFIINSVSDGELNLTAYKNELSKENIKLTLSAVLSGNKKRNYASVIPGISYLISYSNTDKVIIASQLPQSSFAHLKPPSTYIGLSTLNYMIDELVIGTAAYKSVYKDVYTITTGIIPNTDTIVYLKPKKLLRVETHFVKGTYIRNIAYVTSTIAFINIIVLLLLLYRERRRIDAAKTKDTMHPLFYTLQ